MSCVYRDNDQPSMLRTQHGDETGSYGDAVNAGRLLHDIVEQVVSNNCVSSPNYRIFRRAPRFWERARE